METEIDKHRDIFLLRDQRLINRIFDLYRIRFKTYNYRYNNTAGTYAGTFEYFCREINNIFRQEIIRWHWLSTKDGRLIVKWNYQK